MNSSEALKSVLSSLGVSVYQDKVMLDPDQTPATYLIYKKIAERNWTATNGSRVGLTRSRFQITHVADTNAARATLVQNVKNALMSNIANFNGVEASDVHMEDREDKSIFTAVKDYYIWFKE